jgi:hypothetical protein
MPCVLGVAQRLCLQPDPLGVSGTAGNAPESVFMRRRRSGFTCSFVFASPSVAVDRWLWVSDWSWLVQQAGRRAGHSQPSARSSPLGRPVRRLGNGEKTDAANDSPASMVFALSAGGRCGAATRLARLGCWPRSGWRRLRRTSGKGRPATCVGVREGRCGNAIGLRGSGMRGAAARA